MAEKLNYHEIFPDEVADLVEAVGLPDIYLGPAYRGNGNGGKAALEKLEKFIEDELAAAETGADDADSR